MILVEKVSRSAVVRRDDIVFFTPPPVLREVVSSAGGALGSGDLFVKRVAGLPGDTVTVDADGSVEVRPREAASGRLPEQRGGGGEEGAGDSSDAAGGGGGGGGGAVDTERAGGGRSRSSSSSSRTEKKNKKKVVLPDSVLRRIARVDGEVLDREGVFVLGDNPAASMDSRVWGPLDEGEIVGHALLRVLPPRSFGLLQ